MAAEFELRKGTRNSAGPRSEVDLYVARMLPIDKPIGPADTAKRVKLTVDASTGVLLTEATGQRIEKDSSGKDFVVTLVTKKSVGILWSGPT